MKSNKIGDVLVSDDGLFEVWARGCTYTPGGPARIKYDDHDHDGSADEAEWDRVEIVVMPERNKKNCMHATVSLSNFSCNICKRWRPRDDKIFRQELSQAMTYALADQIVDAILEEAESQRGQTRDEHDEEMADAARDELLISQREGR